MIATTEEYKRQEIRDSVLGRIYIKDIKDMGVLPYKSIKSIKKWCKTHNLKLLGMGKRYVLETFFEEALVRQVIKDVQKAYGVEWVKVLKSELMLNPLHKRIFKEAKESHEPYFISSVSLTPMPNEPIELPKKGQQHPVVKLWCRTCRTEPSLNCGHQDHRNRKLDACNTGAICYKIVIKQGGRRITRLINAKSFDDAIQAGIALQKNEVKPEMQPIAPANQNLAFAKTGNNPNRSIESLKGQYMNFLKDINTPPQLKQGLSYDYIKSIEKVFATFEECLGKSNRSLADSIDSLDDFTVGLFHDFLKERGLSDRSYDKYMGAMKTFEKWLQLEGIPIKNPFSKVKKTNKGHEPIAITKEEFENILRVLKPENGIVETPKQVKKKRNYFYDFLPIAYPIAITTGARREELINLRFSSVIEDKFGNPELIKVQNYKINHIQHRSGNNLKYHYIPISKNLNFLLKQLGYEEYKTTGVDKYLIAPNFQGNRDKMLPEILSRSFAHFNVVAGNKRDLAFGSCRKRYITDMEIFTKGRAVDVTGHSDRQVLDQHYIDRVEVAKSVKNFEVFSNDYSERNSDLEEIRNNQLKFKTIER